MSDRSLAIALTPEDQSNINRALTLSSCRIIAERVYADFIRGGREYTIEQAIEFAKSVEAKILAGLTSDNIELLKRQGLLRLNIYSNEMDGTQSPLEQNRRISEGRAFSEFADTRDFIDLLDADIKRLVPELTYYFRVDMPVWGHGVYLELRTSAES